MLRKPNSLSKDDIVIKDPVLEPYFITRSKSTGGFTVYERVSVGKKDTKYIKTISYPSNFQNCLKTVIQEKLHNSDKKEFSTLKEYYKDWQEITDKVNKVQVVD